MWELSGVWFIFDKSSVTLDFDYRLLTVRRVKMLENSHSQSDLVTFFSPHGGRRGALLPLGQSVVMAAAALDGQTMQLSEAVRRVKAFGVRRVSVDSEAGMILYETAGAVWGSAASHIYCLIRFRPADPPHQFESAIEPLGLRPP